MFFRITRYDRFEPHSPVTARSSSSVRLAEDEDSQLASRLGRCAGGWSGTEPYTGCAGRRRRNGAPRRHVANPPTRRYLATYPPSAHRHASFALLHQWTRRFPSVPLDRLTLLVLLFPLSAPSFSPPSRFFGSRLSLYLDSNCRVSLVSTWYPKHRDAW